MYSWFRHLPSSTQSPRSTERWQRKDHDSVYCLTNTFHLISTTTQQGSWRLCIPILQLRFLRFRELEWCLGSYSQFSGRVSNQLPIETGTTKRVTPKTETGVTSGAFAQPARPRWSMTSSPRPRVDWFPSLPSYIQQSLLHIRWDIHVTHSVPSDTSRTLLLMINYKNNSRDAETEFIENVPRTIIGRLS